jgi:hypothetical protein
LQDASSLVDDSGKRAGNVDDDLEDGNVRAKRRKITQLQAKVMVCMTV